MSDQILILGLYNIRLNLNMKLNPVGALLLAVIILSSCEKAVPDSRATFEVTVENLSEGEIATPLSPGVYLTKKGGFPLFFNNAQDFGRGLSEIAGDGNPTVLLESLENDPSVITAGRLDLIPPGTSSTITFEADYGTFFNFANMFVESNDLFYAFDEDGVHLFEPDGAPINEDVTRLVWLWDVGGELNQEPYVGSFQPRRQSFPGEGDPDIDKDVRLVSDEFDYPPKFTVIRVTITGTLL